MAATEVQVAVDQIVTFQGYADPSMTEDQKLLKVGQKVKVQSINQDGGMVVMPVDEKGNQIEGAQGDTVFPEEIAVEAAPAAKGKGKGKGAAATKAADSTPAPTEVTKVEEAKGKKGKGKGAAATKAAKTETAPKAETKAKKGAAATKAAKAPAKVETEQAADPFIVRNITDSESVKRILEESDDVLAAAKSLVQQAEETDFTLGGVLHHIYAEGIHKAAGFQGKRGFATYVEQELGVQYRKAMYLIKIYTTFRQLDVDEARLAEIGWSKAKELARIPADVLTEKFDDLIEEAKAKNKNDLIAHIQREYINAQTGGTTERVQKVKFGPFALVGSAADTVNSAFTSAKNLVGSDDLNAVFEYIVGEWAMMTDGVEVSLEQAIANLETRFGVKLQVVEDADTGDGVTADADQTAEAGA